MKHSQIRASRQVSGSGSPFRGKRAGLLRCEASIVSVDYMRGFIQRFMADSHDVVSEFFLAAQLFARFFFL